MNGGRGALAFLGILLLAAPSAWAAQGGFDLQADLPVTVAGDHTASAERGAFVLEGDAGRISVLLEGKEGTLERVIHRAFGYIKPDEPQLGVLMEQRVEREELGLETSWVTIADRNEDFTLLAYDGALEMTPGASREPLHLGALQESRTIQSTAEPPIEIVLGEKDAKPFLYTLRSGLYEARAMDGRLEADGPLTLYIGDAVVDYTGPDGAERILAHFREEERPGRIYDPTSRSWIGGGTHTEYVHEYLVLRLDDARLQVQYDGTPAILYAGHPAVDVVGTASFPAAVGRVAVTEEDTTTVHEVDGEDLTLAGRFGFTLGQMDAARSRTAIEGSGDLTEVTYAAQTHSYDWTAVAVAGLGALLLAAFAWVSGAAKWLAGGIAALIPGYARVQGEEILEHPGRLEVYERIKADPGMHFVELGEKVPFGASTLNYHLRVLEKNAYVTRVKDGRYVRFFDRKNGEYSRDRKQAASTLRNDTTAAIASHIIHNPGIAQRDLAEHFGIAPSTVSWHVTRLQKDGLIDKQRDQHFTRYYMGRAWSELPTAELARVGLVA